MATQDKKELPACPVETTLMLIGNNMCPVHPHMSAGRDFFDSLAPASGPGCGGVFARRRGGTVYSFSS